MSHHQNLIICGRIHKHDFLICGGGNHNQSKVNATLCITACITAVTRFIESEGGPLQYVPQCFFIILGFPVANFLNLASQKSFQSLN